MRPIAQLLFFVFLATGSLTCGAHAVKQSAAGAKEAVGEPQTVLDLLARGGPLMYPIYGASVLALAFALERAISLRRRRVLPPAFIKKLRHLSDRTPLDLPAILAFCEANDNPVARMVGAGLRKTVRSLPDLEKAIEDAGSREARRLRQNTRVLMGVASVTPLVGLLGTVIGMINAFWSLGYADPLRRSEALANGIYQALLTTAAGLSVAIPSLVLYLYFLGKIERLVTELDEVAVNFVERIAEERGGIPTWEAKP